MHKVVVLAFDEATASDVCGSADVFSVATKSFQRPDQRPYHVTVASVRGQPPNHNLSGIAIETTPLSKIDPASIESLIVPGGAPPHAPPVPQEVVDWFAREGGHARRLCGICTCTFLLAGAGLISDRKVTTHWQATDALRARQIRHCASRLTASTCMTVDCGHQAALRQEWIWHLP
ncbi:DJ-1/PfpI family protein [Duganella hordei]|uniref:DJ-1/PfpI family protein n=1 Tax=Duganella hordei TaxID=2865934 RepID=UPI003341527A